MSSAEMVLPSNGFAIDKTIIHSSLNLTADVGAFHANMHTYSSHRW